MCNFVQKIICFRMNAILWQNWFRIKMKSMRNFAQKSDLVQKSDFAQKCDLVQKSDLVQKNMKL